MAGRPGRAGYGMAPVQSLNQAWVMVMDSGLSVLYGYGYDFEKGQYFALAALANAETYSH